MKIHDALSFFGKKMGDDTEFAVFCHACSAGSGMRIQAAFITEKQLYDKIIAWQE